MTAYNTDGNSPQAEKFLFEQCFMEEVRLLEKGYAFKCDGITYLLTARVIQFVFDLAELCKSAKVQCQNSQTGCPFCYESHGIHRMKMVYSGDRCKLCWKHILRTIGQTACCCPKYYYSKDAKYTNSRHGKTFYDTYRFRKRKNGRRTEELTFEETIVMNAKERADDVREVGNNVAE